MSTIHEKEKEMKKTLLTVGALAAVALTVPAQAGDQVLGAVLGAGVGAVIGQGISGRDGAIIGGAIGAAAGASAASNRHRDYGYGNNVSASVNVGYPGYYAPPPPVYYQPAPVVVYESRPVYVRPAPVVYYEPAYYPVRYHRHHHHDWDD